jgi:hypothetical protein
MRAAVVSELRKVQQSRLWWLLLIAMAAYVGFVALMLSFTFTAVGSDAQLSGVDAAKSAYSAVNGVGYVFPLVLGTMMVTTEFRHRTISTTLIAVPRRTGLLVAKILAAIPYGLGFGLVASLAAVVCAAPMLVIQGEGTKVGEPAVLLGVLLGIVTTAMWTMMGVAFGALIRNQVAAIVILLIFTQFVEPIARLLFAAFDGLRDVSAFLPGAAADAVIGASFFGDMVSNSLLPPWGGVLVLCGYIVAFAVLARLISLERDVA